MEAVGNRRLQFHFQCSWISGYFNYWIFLYNIYCTQFTGHLNVWNTFTIKGWHYKIANRKISKISGATE